MGQVPEEENKMRKITRHPLTLVILLVVVAGLGYWRWQQAQQRRTQELQVRLNELGQRRMGGPAVTPDAFERFGAQAIRPLLGKLESADANTLAKQQAAEALGLLKAEEAIPALTKATESDEAEIRNAAIDALGRIGTPETIHFLLGLLEQEAPRAHAAQALGEAKAEEAREPLLKLLEADDPEAARAAAVALGQIGGEGVAEKLASALKKDDRRLAVATGLSLLGDQRGLEALGQFVRTGSPEDRGAAAQALSQVGEAAVPLLLDILKASPPEAQQSAIQALGKIGSPEAIEALSQALEGQQVGVAVAAATALGQIGSAAENPDIIHTVLQVLRTNMGKDKPEVRVAMAGAFFDLGEPALPTLHEALQDPNPLVRSTAARALSLIQSRKSVDVLLQALQDKDADTRGLAATALGAIGEARALEPLKALTQDPDKEVARRAQTAVRMIGFSQ